MASRQHEAIAVGPIRRTGIKFQKAREQHGGHIGGAHGQAGMAGIGSLDRINGQSADGIGHLVVRHALLGLCSDGHGMIRLGCNVQGCEAV